ncbi:MAG: hypothetical protein NWP61_05880 [Rickettsiaceae bacterium]|nr:hypothetical protein [Rickettsiaceae bacterium]
MGIEVVLVIAITSGVISLISGGVSIGSFFHFKQKFSAVTKDTTTVDIENEMVEEDVEWGHKKTKKQKIHIEDIDFETVNNEMGITRTGLPNATAERLAGGASDALKLISAPTSAIGGGKLDYEPEHATEKALAKNHPKAKKVMQKDISASDSEDEMELALPKTIKSSSIKIEEMINTPEVLLITASAEIMGESAAHDLSDSQ